MLIYCLIGLANAGPPTLEVKKMLIPGLIFFSTTSGETTEDCQFDPGDVMWAIFSEGQRVNLPKLDRNDATKSKSWKGDV
jgi:hypothetical protein